MSAPANHLSIGVNRGARAIEASVVVSLDYSDFPPDPHLAMHAIDEAAHEAKVRVMETMQAIAKEGS